MKYENVAHNPYLNQVGKLHYRHYQSDEFNRSPQAQYTLGLSKGFRTLQFLAVSAFILFLVFNDSGRDKQD